MFSSNRFLGIYTSSEDETVQNSLWIQKIYKNTTDLSDPSTAAGTQRPHLLWLLNIIYKCSQTRNCTLNPLPTPLSRSSTYSVPNIFHRIDAIPINIRHHVRSLNHTTPNGNNTKEMTQIVIALLPPNKQHIKVCFSDLLNLSYFTVQCTITYIHRPISDG